MTADVEKHEVESSRLEYEYEYEYEMKGRNAMGEGHDVDEVGLPPPPPTMTWRRALVLVLVLVLVLGSLFAAGLIPHLHREAQLAADAERVRTELPRVSIVRPRPAPRTTEVTLPGTIEALQETTIYARVNGYLRRWVVDIGDPVTAGALLAEIDTPELDQELVQAAATERQLAARLETARANVALAESSFKRYDAAAAKGGISPQERDEREASLATARASTAAAEADLAAGRASVSRLTEMKSFARVLAPFAGTVTRRTVEVGSLVMAGNGMSQALFHVAETDTVRLFVDVPQSFAAGVRDGLAADLAIREFPGRKFEARVTRTSRSLDPATRTLLTEIHVKNGEGVLLPGMFARARIELERERPGLIVPASALVVSAEGTEVALVVEGDQIHFQKVDVGEDRGTEIAIASGLAGDERVVANPGERLAEGIAVKVSEPKTDAKPAAAEKPATEKPREGAKREAEADGAKAKRAG